MNHQLHTEIAINAAPQTIWRILTDFDNYTEWNPFVVSAEGQAAVGQKLTNRIEPPGGKPMTFRPTVTIVKTDQLLEWLGRFGLPGIFDGRHRFELHATQNGTRFVHSETFKGLLVPFLRKSLNEKTKAGFQAMNAALKTRAEAAQT